MKVLLALLQLGGLTPDSIETLRDRARSAEARYERLARSTAPFSWRGGSGSDCDEVVGRFCIRFDSVSTPPVAPENHRVREARREAIEAARRYFSAAPADVRAAGPLVRLLIRDGRAREAASAAGAYRGLSGDTLWGELLLGFALHASGEDSASSGHFDAALASMDASMRRRWSDPSWLLDHAERRVARRLDAAARADYERRLWRLSDPFWSTAANERWLEHLSRHTESALLREVPFVTGMTSWGDDMYQLTVRYGTPTSRTRENGPLAVSSSSLVEHWDSASRSYVPERLLTNGYPAPQEPGAKPLLYAGRARSAYAWAAVTRVLELSHQITRFLRAREVVFRVDAALRADSAPAGSSLTAALFVADSSLFAIRTARARVPWRGDSARFTLVTASAPGSLIYSVEAIDLAANTAARARYAVASHMPHERPWVSDLLICYAHAPQAHPAHFEDPSLRARTSLTLEPGDTIGLYAEVYGLAGAGATALELELTLQPADDPSMVRRLFSWIGRSVGLLDPPTEPRVAWRAEPQDTVHAVSLNLPLDPQLQGRYELILRATDRSTGRAAVSRRLIRVER